jgi:hypothetical protein
VDVRPAVGWQTLSLNELVAPGIIIMGVGREEVITSIRLKLATNLARIKDKSFPNFNR